MSLPRFTDVVFFSLFSLSTSVLIHTRPPAVCSYGVCFNGGHCREGSTQLCDCPAGFNGPSCQYGESKSNAWLLSCFLAHKCSVASLRRTPPCAPVPTEPTAECSAFCSTSTLNSLSRDHLSAARKAESPHISTWLLQQQSQYFISDSTVVV